MFPYCLDIAQGSLQIPFGKWGGFKWAYPKRVKSSPYSHLKFQKYMQCGTAFNVKNDAFMNMLT